MIAFRGFRKAKQTLPDSYLSCLLQVKKYDRENYLAGICLKQYRIRRAVFALRAFNVELSLIRDKTTDTDRAKIRFLFWSKLVEEIERRNSADLSELDDEKKDSYYKFTPVAKELIEVFHQIDLDEDLIGNLKDLIGSRLSPKVLGYQPFVTMDELETYCSKSNSPIYWLSWNIFRQLNYIWDLDDESYEITKITSKNLGLAHGLTNVMRSIPLNATKGCCFIPESVLKETNLTSDDFKLNFKRKNLDGEKLKPAIEYLAVHCRETIRKAMINLPDMPRESRILFLPYIAILSYLRKLEKCNFDVCDSNLYVRDNLLPLNFWLSSKFYRAPLI